MMRLCWTLFLGLTAAAAALAQPPAPPTAQPDVPITTLSLSPMPAPAPALRYKLLPELRDTTPGNAALLYYRAFAPEWWGSYRREPKIAEALDEAQSWPPDRLRHLPESDANLVGWVRNSTMLKEVDRASRRAYCDWDLTPRVREDGFGLLLPDAQSLRGFAQMLAVRARLELADGQFDQAARTLQTGLQMGRHAANAPTLIQALIGAATTAVMLNQVEEWVRTPNSPNLYWALTNLPQPFIDLRKPMEGERMMLDNVFPGMREALTDPTTPPLSTDKLLEMVARFNEVAGGSRETPGLIVAMVVAKKYGAAKEYLRQHGRTAEQVEALTALEAVLLYEVANYDRLFDEMHRLQGLPYSTVLPALEQFDRRLKEDVVHSGGPGSPAYLLLPAVAKVQFAAARTDRRINALRCVEAIRLYAAAHGKLPGKLDDLEVPVPLDPVTGKLFDYRLDGDKALLTGPTPTGQQPHVGNTLRYEITLRR